MKVCALWKQNRSMSPPLWAFSYQLRSKVDDLRRRRVDIFKKLTDLIAAHWAYVEIKTSGFVQEGRIFHSRIERLPQNTCLLFRNARGSREWSRNRLTRNDEFERGSLRLIVDKIHYQWDVLKRRFFL